MERGYWHGYEDPWLLLPLLLTLPLTLPLQMASRIHDTLSALPQGLLALRPRNRIDSAKCRGEDTLTTDISHYEHSE